MYRIQNIGVPNFRTHQVATSQVIQGGRKISDDRIEKKEFIGPDGRGNIVDIKHTGVTFIEPNRTTVHVTDDLGKRLEKYPEIVVLEKVKDKPKGK